MKSSEYLNQLAQDTLKGLSSDPKYLLPKYFYDANGSRIFQDIMKNAQKHSVVTLKEHIPSTGFTILL